MNYLDQLAGQADSSLDALHKRFMINKNDFTDAQQKRLQDEILKRRRMAVTDNNLDNGKLTTDY